MRRCLDKEGAGRVGREAGRAHPGFFLWFCPLRLQSPRAWTGAGPAAPGLCFTALAPSSWRPSVLTGVTWTWAATEPLLQETRVAAPVRGRVRGAETGPWGSGGLCSWALLLQDHLRHRLFCSPFSLDCVVLPCAGWCVLGFLLEFAGLREVQGHEVSFTLHCCSTFCWKDSFLQARRPGREGLLPVPCSVPWLVHFCPQARATGPW